jgi:hypothetical protein
VAEAGQPQGQQVQVLTVAPVLQAPQLAEAAAGVVLVERLQLLV